MSKLIFLDTETTTHLLDRVKMWQFASKIYDTENKDWKSFNIIINPQSEFSIDALVKCHPNIKEINDSPNFKDVAHNVAEALCLNNDAKVYYVAHNAKFDRSALVKEFKLLGINTSKLEDTSNWIDTYKLAIQKYQDSVFSDINGEGQQVKLSLEFLYYYCGLEIDDEINFHSANFDVEILIKLFKHLKGERTLDDLVEISMNPVLLNRIRFGKHEGKLITDVVHNDFKYIQWMVQNLDSLDPDNSNFDENLYYTIQQNIKDL